jgi:hypothetical protein
MIRVYIGPSIPGLKSYTVFSGALPKPIAELAAMNDNVAGLIIPVERLQESRRDMRKRGHVLNVYFHKLLEGVKNHGV